MDGRARSPVQCFLAYSVLLCLCFVSSINSGSISLNNGNVDDVLANNEVVLVNFYADWCRFSQMLKPVFEESADNINKEFPESGRVVMASVDCDREASIAQRFHINKYPTLKLFRGGEMQKKEYRGQRSPQAIASFLRDQVKEIIHEHPNLEEIDSLNENQRIIIGYFATRDSDAFRNFEKAAGRLRDDCSFHLAIGDVSARERQSGDSIVYRPPKTLHEDVAYMGQPSQFDSLLMWMTDKCVPLVREITFENAEELTEEGLPFLILFHHPDDTETPKIFQLEVARQVINEKSSVNFLTADGLKFSHPLHHLGKHQSDLPVLAIDSFRHMYLFPHDVKTGIQTPGILQEFINDLHSGKLHKEFHEGPSPPTTKPPQQVEIKVDETGKVTKEEHIPIAPDNDESDTKPASDKEPTSPPESTFKKLAPSRNRYTLLRDEL